MGQDETDAKKSNVIDFAFPQCRELDEDLEGDMYSLIIFASRLRNKKRRRLLIETVHRFLTLEVAGDSINYEQELGEAIIAPKLFELYREVGGLSFQRAIEAALDHDSKHLKPED